MKSILSAVVGATLALSAIEADAQATPGDRQVSLTIESTSLATALDKWAQQSGFQIFVQDWEGAKNLPARSLKGTFTAQDALEQLLSGTQLTYVWISDKAVSIRKKTLQTVPTALQRIGLEGQQSIPVAKFSGDDGAGLGSGQSGTAASDESGQTSLHLRDFAIGDRVQELEEVLVTGSQIRGVQNATVPIVVLSKDFIELTGVSTTTDLMAELPQNFALASQSGVGTPGVSSDGAQGSSINLRGIGAGTTLTLLDGRRMPSGFNGSAVDISALPLSAIERVEILPDGASALYGSDAVGGVVNFVLKKDFEGAETRARSGWADGGVNEYNLGQVLGGTWNSGNALLSLDYHKRDLLRASDRDFVPSTSLIGSLLPRDENYSALLSGRQRLGERVSLFADAFYLKRSTYNEGGQTASHTSYTSDIPQVSVAGGLTWDFGRGWQMEASGSSAANELHQSQHTDPDEVLLRGYNTDTDFHIRTGRLKADGPLFQLPGGVARLAIGSDWRYEHYVSTSSTVLATGDPFGFHVDKDQSVTSGFAEMYVPVVGASNAVGGIRRLELSLAGRLDDYSSFGSSFDPKYGLMWEPLPGLRLRASYGTSYKAPDLPDYDVSVNSGIAFYGPNPDSPEDFPYTTHQILLFGNNAAGFAAQESRSVSLGVEFAPAAIQGLQIGLNYYKIDYRNRISQPDYAFAVFNAASAGGLITRSPSLAQVDAAIAASQLGTGGFVAYDPDSNVDINFDPASVSFIFDLRRRNLSEVSTRGFDVSAQYSFELSGNTFEFGLAGTYIDELVQRLTSASEPLDSVDTIYNPPDWRAHGFVGWQHGGWAASLSVNHTDSYVDTRTSVPTPIASYTTVDARLAYEFVNAGTPLFSGLTLAVSAQNLLNEDPPRADVFSPEIDMGFDPTNANPMGRMVSLELVKSW